MAKAEKYNLFAILSLIFTFVMYPAGLIFAFVALSEIKKTKEKGKWMAWIPIGIGIALLGLFVLGVIWGVVSGVLRAGAH